MGGASAGFLKSSVQDNNNCTEKNNIHALTLKIIQIIYYCLVGNDEQSKKKKHPVQSKKGRCA